MKVSHGKNFGSMETVKEEEDEEVVEEKDSEAPSAKAQTGKGTRFSSLTRRLYLLCAIAGNL